MNKAIFQSPTAALSQASVAERQRALAPVGVAIMAQALYFTCPATSQRASTGIQTDVETLQAFWKRRINVDCPCCGKFHDIAVREAYMDSVLLDACDLLAK
jgi:hypothetical protein